MICPLPTVAQGPGLLRALNPDWITGVVSGQMLTAGRVRALRPHYIRYKREDGSLVGWQLELERDGVVHDTWVTARIAADWRLRAELERVPDPGDEAPGLMRPAVLCAEAGVLLRAFPSDRELRDLPRILRASKVRGFLLERRPELVPAGQRIAKSRSTAQVLRYKPERRAVVRWTLALVDGDQVRGGLGVFVRLHAEPLGGAAVRALGAARAAGVACPEVLTLVHERLVLEAQLPGAPVTAWSAAHYTAAAQTLAAVHAAPVPSELQVHGGLAELDAVLRACGDLDQLGPELGAAAHRVADQLAAWVPPPTEAQLLHGDFHPGQLLFAGTQAGVVDFDRAAAGPPAYDLASFQVHCLDQGATGVVDADALAAAYGRQAPLPDPRVLRWFQAGAAVRFAMTPFRRLDPDWPARVRSLLERGAAWAAEATR